METDDVAENNPTKRFLETRMCGACMAINRLLGFHVVRCTRPVEYIWPQFTPEPGRNIPRTPEHRSRNQDYPDPEYYLGPTQRYFFRNPELQHLRINQVVRYFTRSPGLGQAEADKGAKDTTEDTCNRDRDRPDEVEDADEAHRH